VSYILDALKRSERSRQLHRPLAYRSEQPSAPAVPMALVVSLGAVLLAGAVGTIFWWRASPPTPDPEMALAGTTARRSASASVSSGSAPQAAGRVAGDGASMRLARAVLDPTRSAPLPGRDDAGPIPLLSAMPSDFQERLPPMEVNIHVFSPDPSQCILSINNRPYRQGDEITGGAVVEEIVPDGVVLYYDGQRFRLPRPR
jgi:general secretion pathway protein B